MKAHVRPEKIASLRRAVQEQTIGSGSVAEGEYLRCLRQARRMEDGSARWVEVCYCPTPLEEEIPYWEEFFQIERIRDAHSRRKCRDETGEEPWACSNCDCTRKLEAKMEGWGEPFLPSLNSERIEPLTAGHEDSERESTRSGLGSEGLENSVDRSVPK